MRPLQRCALAVGDGDDVVVERSVDVGDAIGDDALDLLLRLGSGWFGHVCFLYFLMALRRPLRVRALVRVRWPRSGRPRRWRMSRSDRQSVVSGTRVSVHVNPAFEYILKTYISITN